MKQDLLQQRRLLLVIATYGKPETCFSVGQIVMKSGQACRVGVLIKVVLDQLSPHVRHVGVMRIEIGKGRFELKVETSLWTLELIVLLEPDPVQWGLSDDARPNLGVVGVSGRQIEDGRNEIVFLRYLQLLVQLKFAPLGNLFRRNLFRHVLGPVPWLNLEKNISKLIKNSFLSKYGTRYFFMKDRESSIYFTLISVALVLDRY